MSFLILIIAAMFSADQRIGVLAGPILGLLTVAVYCSAQKQRVVFLPVVGGVAAFAFLACLTLATLVAGLFHGSIGTLGVAICLWAALLAAFAACMVVFLVVGPSKRRVGILVGLLVAFVVGRGFALLLPPDLFPHASASQMRFLLPLLPGLLFGLDLGWFFSLENKAMWQRWAVSGIVVLICAVGLVARVADISRGTYRCYSLKELEASQNVRGLIGKTRSANLEVQSSASAAAAMARGPEAVDYQLLLLRRHDQFYRGEAASSLRAAGDDRWLTILAEDMRDPDERVRRSAIIIMATTDFERCKAYIEAATRDTSPAVRRTAEALLTKKPKPMQYAPAH